MAIVEISARADRDMFEIATTIAEDNVTAAERWLSEIDTSIQLLATQPETGERYQARHGREIRRRSHGAYVIYFKPITNGVEIIRVVHGARDHRRLI